MCSSAFPEPMPRRCSRPLPARAGAPVLTAMLPSAAARVLDALDDDAGARAAERGRRAGGGDGAAHIPEPRRSRLLGGLPTATAVASRLLLGYPDDSVGAWADPDVIALAPETSASDALARVRGGDERNVEQVYAVDHDQRLIGIVDLLEAAARARLDDARGSPAQAAWRCSPR